MNKPLQTFILVLYSLAFLGDLRADTVQNLKAGETQAGVTSSQPEADAAWARFGSEPLVNTVGGLSYNEAFEKWPVGSEEHWKVVKWMEQSRQQYRRLGLEFWDRFPSDPRRFEWLVATMSWPPFYWKDIELGARMFVQGTPQLATFDTKARAEWDGRYIAMRAEFMTAPRVAGKVAGLRNSLRFAEFSERVGSHYGGSAKNLQLNRSILANEIWDHAEYRIEQGQSGLSLLSPAKFLLQSMEEDPAAELAFISALKLSSDPDFRWLGNGRHQEILLRERPLELQLPTLEGEQIDLVALRGKVVLVDMWSNYCASCIEAMPKVKGVYEKFRNQGFEVVGIWLDLDVHLPRAQRDKKPQTKARSILKKQGATWPNGVIAGDDVKKFEDRYAITGVPVTWLLNQQGLLVTRNVSGPRLESEVRRLLGL